MTAPSRRLSTSAAWAVCIATIGSETGGRPSRRAHEDDVAGTRPKAREQQLGEHVRRPHGELVLGVQFGRRGVVQVTTEVLATAVHQQVDLLAPGREPRRHLVQAALGSEIGHQRRAASAAQHGDFRQGGRGPAEELNRGALTRQGQRDGSADPL